jgi:hypothetical protein
VVQLERTVGVEEAVERVRPVDGASEADRVLARLERIDTLRGSAGQGAALLGELRALVGEAEVWARAEGDARARAAAAKLRERTEGMR